MQRSEDEHSNQQHVKAGREEMKRVLVVSELQACRSPATPCRIEHVAIPGAVAQNGGGRSKAGAFPCALLHSDKVEAELKVVTKVPKC